MITGRTDTIGLSVLDITNPHFSSILKGAQRVANDHGYTVLLVDTEENPSRERRVLEDLSRRVDGMIVARACAKRRWAGWRIDKPLVFFGSLAELPLPTVASDDHGGAFMLAQHLKMLGHRASPTSAFRSRAATRSAWAASANAWTPPACRWRVRRRQPLAGRGRAPVLEHRAGQPAPDALICYNDLMALGFMKEAAQPGRVGAARYLGGRLRQYPLRQIRHAGADHGRPAERADGRVGHGKAAGSPASYVPPLATTPMNRIVQDNAYKQLDYFFPEAGRGKGSHRHRRPGAVQEQRQILAR
jgi:hypothetical protein